MPPSAKPYRGRHRRRKRHRARDRVGLCAGGRAHGAARHINEKSASEAAREIRDGGGKAESFALDVTRREDCIARQSRSADKVGKCRSCHRCRHRPPQRHDRRSRGRDQDWGRHHRRQPDRRVQRDACVSSGVVAATKRRIVNIGSIQSFVHVRTAKLARLQTASNTACSASPAALGRRALQGRRARQRDRPPASSRRR